MPLVSVIIPNWNGAHLLPTCLDSIRTQTLQDFEVVVVDNASTDGSLQLLAERYPEVKVIALHKNLGFSDAVNVGIQAGAGEFVALLNNDTELDPRYLEELASVFRLPPSPGLEREQGGQVRLGTCAPKMVYYDNPSIINSAGHACGPDGVVVDIGRGQPDGPQFSESREVLGPCAGAALYRREMLQQVGLFDPDFFLSFEDADLNWRAQWAGWRCRYIPTAVVRHREGASREIRSRRAVLLGLRNTIHIWIKDWPVSALLRHFPSIWRGLFHSMASLSFRGYGDVLPGVLLGVLAQTSTMLTRRWRIRRTRSVPVSRFEELLALGRRDAPMPGPLKPFDSGIRLGILRLGRQACTAVLSLFILLLVLGMATLTDATEVITGRTYRPTKTR